MSILHSVKAYYDTGRERSTLISTPGLWIDGQMHWLGEANEKLLPAAELSIKVKQLNIHSKVDFFDIYVTNHSFSKREAKLIVMHRHPEAVNEHFSYVSPSEEVIYHFAEKKMFLVNGRNSSGKMKQCTVQPLWNIHTDRLWNCQEAGTLNYQPMAQGATASLFSLDLALDPRQTERNSCWTIEGIEKTALMSINHLLLKNTLAFPEKK